MTAFSSPTFSLDSVTDVAPRSPQAFDTGLNALPFVGAAKNAIEVVRGRDFFPDRYGPGGVPSRASR